MSIVFGERRFDAFYAANDAEVTTQAYVSTTITAPGFTVLGEGNTVTIGSSAGIVAGAVGLIAGVGYFDVLDVVDATHVVLRPLFTSRNPTGVFAIVGTVVAGGTAFTIDGSGNGGLATALQQTVDLRDAPPTQVYDYLFMGHAALGCMVGNGSRVNAQMRILGLYDDVYGAETGPQNQRRNRASVTVKTAGAGHRYGYHSIARFRLNAGQTYFQRLEVGVITAGGTATMRNAHILALRINTSHAYFVDNGDTTDSDAAITNASAVTFVEDTGSRITVPAGVTAGMKFLLVGCAMVKNDNATRANRKVEVDVSTIANPPTAKILCEDAADEVSIGFTRFVTGLVAGNTVAWRFRAPAGATSSMRCSYLALVPLEAIYAGQEFVDPAATVGTSPIAMTQAFTDVATSAATSIVESDTIEFISATTGGNAGDNSAIVRPFFSGDPAIYYDQLRTPRGRVGREGLDGDLTQMGFWFWRGHRASGSFQNRLQARRAGTATGLNVGTVRFPVIRERSRYKPQPGGDRTTLVAEIEYGQVWGLWAVAGTDTFDRYLPDYGLVTRTLRNGVDMTRSTSLAAVAAGAADSWFWDITTKKLRVKMPAGKTPADIDQTVMAVQPLLFSLLPGEVLIDSDGIERPYDARLLDVPTVTQRLDIRKAGIEAGVTFGTIRLSNGDGFFDDLRQQGTFKGLFARVFRGYRDASRKLVELDDMVAGIMDKPDVGPDVCTIKYADLGVALARPINKTNVTVYQGDTQVPNFLLPTYWGWGYRLRAVRTTNLKNAADVNTYKICGHAIKSISNVWRSGADQTAIAGAKWTADLANGAVNVTNDGIDATGWPKTAPDVLYVDIGGRDLGVEGIFDEPGAIGEDVLKSFSTFTDATLDKLSWRKLARRHRRKRSTTNPSVEQRLPMSMGLLAEGSQDVRSVTTKLAKTAWAYLAQTRSGKARIGVVDHSHAGLAVNPGGDLGVKWPWRAGGLGSALLNGTQQFDGSKCFEVSNGSWGDWRQRVTLERSGWHIVTAVVALKTGEGSAARLFMIPPGDGFGRVLSPVFQVSSQRYQRISFPVYVEPGQIGSAVIGVIPYEPLASEASMPTIPGLVLWLRASALTLADGSQIATFTDLSGLGNNATQATAARRPILRYDALAGLAGARFDQVDDVMTTPLAIAAPPLTTYVLYTSEGDRTLRRMVTGSNTGWVIGPYLGVYGFSATAFLAGPAITEDRPVVQSFIQTSATLSEGFINGVSVGTLVSAGQVAPGTVSIGNLGEPAGSTLFDLIMANEAHDAATHAAICRALMLRGGTAAATLLVDSIDCVPVAAVWEPRDADDGKIGPALAARVSRMTSRAEDAYEVRVAFNPNLQDWDSAPGALITDEQARGRTTLYEPDKSFALATLQTAGRIDHTKSRDVIIASSDATKGLASALAVAAPLAIRFSREGALFAGDMIGLDRRPEIGEFIYVPPTKRVGQQRVVDPFWLLTEVTESKDVTDVEFIATQPIDPVADRGDVAPSFFPLGYMGVSLTAAAITGWDEVSELRGKYLVASATASISGVFGALWHLHTLQHGHPVAEHWHEYDVASIGPSEPSGFDPAGRTSFDEGEAEIAFGPHIDVSRGRSSGDHDHDVTLPGDANPHQSEHRTGLTSGNPTVTLNTREGPTEIKNKRVTVRRKTGGADEIPQNVCIGWLSNVMPNADWVRETALDGYALKVADPTRTGAAKTVQGGGFTVGASGAQTLTLNGSSAIQVGSVIQLSKAGPVVNSVIVEALLGGNAFTVRALWFVGDGPAGTNYPAGSAATPADERAGTSYDASVKHDHGGNGAVPTHQHQTPHDHYEDWPQTPSPGGGTTEHYTGDSDPADKVAVSGGTLVISSDTLHRHRYRPNLLQDATASGNAGGSITQSRDHDAPTYEFVWIKPANPNVKEIPPGGIILGDGQEPPGFARFGASDGFVLKGAATGADSAGGQNGNHGHDYTADGHTYAHLHGELTYTLGDDVNQAFGVREGLGTGVWYAVGYQLGNVVGHRHRVTLSGITQPKPNNALLTAIVGAASGKVKGAASLPRHGTIILYQKL